MVQALIFDVFGTCVDWRSSVITAVTAALPEAEAESFADAWRGAYQPSMAPIRTGQRAYVPLDQLHQETLTALCQERGLPCPPDLARAWERLTPWPDVPSGLARLKSHALIAPCSNGSIALMTRLARHGALPWDCILGADLARTYKPQPDVYRAAVQALQLPADQVMMVAAHNDDLRAARALGLKTGFVLRPTEHGPDQTTDLSAEEDWDMIANDFNDLADRLPHER